MKKIIVILAVIILVLGTVFYFYQASYQEKKTDNKEHIEVEEKETLKEKELFEDYYEQALDILSGMSLEEKIGQLFLVRYDSGSALEGIEKYHPGGYVLFAKDFEYHTKESIHDEILMLQEASKIPLVIAVDEEGGYVTRVSRFNNFRSEKFSSPRSIYDQGGYELLRSVELEKARLLLSIGVNLNLAPVADVSVDPNDFIYYRSFGMDALNTSEFIKNMVDYANESGISSSLKHFPGYGNNVDTHTGIAVDDRSYENFVQNDFLPFQSGIEAKVPTVLVSHNIINCLDSNYPASLSSVVISQLRDYLKFSGIIITDDLAMGAVKDYVLDGRAATLAVKAGNDLIITSDFVNMYDEVLHAVYNEEISVFQIDDSVKRILAWKIAYNMKG